jgi:hypothetical protein
MKTAAILLYLLITSFITIYVGKILFRNGRHYLLSMLLDHAITDSVNRILLTGYYLVNLGYVSMMLTRSRPIETFDDMIVSLTNSIGRIMLTLGVMHYINIATVAIWNRINLNNKS